jgi:predicted secreted protein
MAVHLGKEGIVRVGASPVLVAEVREWELNTTSDTAETTSIPGASANGGWRTHAATLLSWEGSINCFWDETDTNGQQTIDAGSTVALKVYPEGATTGATFFSGSAIVTAVNRKASLDGVVEASFSFKGTGALTEGSAP